MPQRSWFDQLPEELQERVRKLLTNKRLTHDAILEKLEAEMGDDAPSRTALGRTRAKVEEAAAAMQWSVETAKCLRTTLGDMSNDDQSRLNYHLFQSQLFELAMAATRGEEVSSEKVKNIRALADAMYRLAASSKLETDRVLKIKQETAKETALKAADVAVASIEKEFPGVSAAFKQSVYHSVLGVAKT